MIIAGTGTRNIILDPDYMDDLVEHMADLLRQGKVKHPDLTVLCGMAEGFDEAIGLAAITAGVPFHACVPHPTYGDYYWRQHSKTGRDRLFDYMDLLNQAEKTFVVCKRLYEYHDGRSLHANFVRNIAMVNGCNKLWAHAASATDGGTSHCVNYAKSVGKPVYLVEVEYDE